MSALLGQNGARIRPGMVLGWRRRALGLLVDVTYAVIGPAEPAGQRLDIMRRALVAAVMIIVLPIQQLRVPGWPAVMSACIVALLYNVPLAHLVFRKQRFFLAHILGVVLDALLLMGASFAVMREMGAANSASDIWLIFVLYILIGGFNLAPIGALLYTALWIGWFALGTNLFFPSWGQFHDQLLVRLVFFAAIGLVSVGIAAELQKRRARLEQQNRQTMGMLATLVEARDTDAGAHLHRIHYFSQVLALHLGFSEREAQEIADASMMHDVGKANVPDAVLKKAGPLSPEEWRIMQEHTVWGDHLLADHHDFEVARWVARSHHEHWDGSGYPDRLVAQQIPLAARVVAVADVYDALISQRPYKEAWPPEAAIQEIQRMAGSHLDPRVVQGFVELWESGLVRAVTEEIEGNGAGEVAAVGHPA